MQTVARIVNVKSSRCSNSGISVMRAAREHGVPRQTLTSPHLCGSKSPSFSTGSMVHTPRLHTPSPVTTSVTPGTPPHLCGSKSPSLSTGSVVYTPGLNTSSPASSSAASTPSSSSYTPHPRSAGSTESSPGGELRYISKYLVQFVPAPPNTKASTAKWISGARVLTSAKCAAILEEQEEKGKSKRRIKERLTGSRRERRKKQQR